MAHARSIDKEVERKVALVVLAERLGVAQACRLLDFSRDTYYRTSKIHAQGGLEALIAATKSCEHRAGRISPDIERAVLEVAEQEPHIGKTKVAAKLEARGLAVSPTGVAAVWERHGLARAQQRRERSARLQANAYGDNIKALISELHLLREDVARLGRERAPRKSATRRSATPVVSSAPVALGASPAGEMFRKLFGAPAIVPDGHEPVNVDDRSPFSAQTSPISPSAMLAMFSTPESGAPDIEPDLDSVGEGGRDGDP
jgi:hypothetical protein